MGIATRPGAERTLDVDAFVRMRDTLTRRGPDDAGLFEGDGMVLGSRRLAVRDPGPEGAQPMRTRDGRHVLVYNGELYNDDDLRRDLEREGHAIERGADTGVLLAAVAAWGAGAIDRLRGMYAFAWADLAEKRLVLARDPLGIKPLYWWTGSTRSGATLVFGSEPAAILEHPDITPRPDPVGVSAYLTTIRTVVEDRTMFEGVRAVRTGETLTFDLDAEPVAPVSRTRRTRLVVDGGGDDLRAAVEQSVAAHLRSDVPVCCLLSGGLDSSAIALCARPRTGDLRTYCAGAPGEAPIDGVPQSEDFRHARLVADELGSRHTEAPVTRERFASQWAWMVRTSGVPLSTPNEVAIHEVALRLREAGDVVALSGEGADELFGGYAGPLLDCAAHVAAGNHEPWRHQLLSTAWIRPEHKAAVLAPTMLAAVEDDAWLHETYREVFTRAERDGPNDDPLQAHLRCHRALNMTGLLRRLDSAMMLASVEGRTPIADVEVAGLAEGLAMDRKFIAGEAGAARTKIALREAFRGSLPDEVIERPKASFPLPFQRWVGDHAETLRGSLVARSLLSEAAIELVARDATSVWSMAWPVINVAMWAERWWGENAQA